MFKAVIYDGENFNEYNSPGIRMDPWKAELIVLFILILTLIIVMKMRIVANFGLGFKEEKIHIENRVDRYGMSNLHRAVINNREKFVLRLINYGVDLNSPDDYGWTPLHWAKFLKRIKISELLIKYGALTDIRSDKDWFIYKKGTTPDDIN